MTRKTIRLLTVEEPGVDGFSIYPTHIQIELEQETYDKFEKDAKRFGLTMDEALAHGIETLLKSGLP